MPIYTPRGLKIRIAVPYAFGLMARLRPKVSPFKVLKTTEGIEEIPGLLAFIAGIVSFSMDLAPLDVGIAVVGAQMVGVLLNVFGYYVIPGLVWVATLWSYVAGFGLFSIVTIVAGFVLAGWQAVLAFFVAKLTAFVLTQPIEFFRTKHYYRLAGHPFTQAEVSFFNAYRVHAERLGLSTNLDLEENELSPDYWGPTFEEFALQWPEVASRLTFD